MYPLLRKLLFKFEAEKSHEVTLKLLHYLHKTPLSYLLRQHLPAMPRQVMGIDFPNPIGLAAGLDKNADYIDVMASLGFGFIEVGTLTLRPQPGNPQPRLFRIPEREAIINRMGFNNKGVNYALGQIRKAKFKGILGINIGKNADTPLDDAKDEYVTCLKRVYHEASYVVINVSSPNTRGLRDLQQEMYLDQLLGAMKQAQSHLADTHQKYVPLLVKVAPDLSDEEVKSIAKRLIKHHIDGVIATNTSVSREGIEDLPISHETGGLSGRPIQELSNYTIRRLHDALSGGLPIIAVGGIMNADDARDKMIAGARLVQLYTGLVYRGPALIKQIAKRVF